MPTGSPTLDRDDIQGLVLRGYRMPEAVYLFYRFRNASGARAWLAGLIDPVTTAADWAAKPAWCANVALAYPALEVLGLPTESLASFPEDFRQGMAARAVTAIGDVGDDLPEHWERSPPFASRGVHAMLLISARDRQELDRRVVVLGGQATATRDVEAVGSQYAAALSNGDKMDTEHFGFRDGISQPVLVGSGLEVDAAGLRTRVAPGEFVLGHSDELGNKPMPWPEALGRNGTYAVYRKLHQDVDAFRRFLRESGDEEVLAAKLMGRWRSGAPLALAKTADDLDLAADPQRNNHFDYTDDPLGYGCPRGAHIRRAHARDGSVTSRRRLLIRRGLPYGPPATEVTAENHDRGLVGVFLNASIERQYEFVQRQWLNWAKFDGLDNDPDPITGPGGGDFTWQRRPLPRRYTALPRFVTVRGGEYFFMPSITAMRLLSDAPPS